VAIRRASDKSWANAENAAWLGLRRLTLTHFPSLAFDGHVSEGVKVIRTLVPIILLAGALVRALPAAGQPGPWGSSGRPDLSGVWTNASMTSLERPATLKGRTLPEAEAKARAAANPLKLAALRDARPMDPNAGPPPVSDGALGSAHSAVFLDAGDSYARINGEYRTSWIVEPANGTLPLTDFGRQSSRAAGITRDRMDPDGPEHLAPNDRCLIGSRGSGGPGMLNNIYNSNYRFLLTPDALVVVVEMGFGVRVIPILKTKTEAQGAHGPAVLHPWMGDSTAWWEGDTLVVETLNVHPTQGNFGPIFLSETGRVTERLTRLSASEIAYDFVVEDPVFYTQTWKAEMVISAMSSDIYEYACHEGNYAIAGILGGARVTEGKAAGR